jgi:protease I
MPKVLILTGDGAEALEVMYPYQRLLEEGFEVDIAAPSAKKIQTVVHDVEEGWDTYTEKLGYKVEANLAFSDVKVGDYVALVVPGGRAPEYIRNDADVKRIIRHFFDKNLPVAHLCHAPLVLAAAGVLGGRQCAAFPFLQPDVELAGATFVDGGGVVDGKMVSARAWFDHPTWMREFMRVLKAHLGKLPGDDSHNEKGNGDKLADHESRLARIERKLSEL